VTCGVRPSIGDERERHLIHIRLKFYPEPVLSRFQNATEFPMTVIANVHPTLLKSGAAAGEAVTTSKRRQEVR
jgi:hypothetical protein